MAEIRQSNGRVAEIQRPLIENRDLIGLTIGSNKIGNSKGADDILERGTRQALEQLIMLAQIHAKVPTAQITRDYSQANMDRVEKYLQDRKVDGAAIQGLLTNIHALKNDKDGAGLSLFDQTYTQFAQITNVATLKLPTSAPTPPSNGQQLALKDSFQFSVRAYSTKMTFPEYAALQMAGDERIAAFGPRMKAYEEVLARKLGEELQFGRNPIDTQGLNLTEIVKAGLKGEYAEDLHPHIAKYLEALKKEEFAVTISMADRRKEERDNLFLVLKDPAAKGTNNNATSVALGKPS